MIKILHEVIDELKKEPEEEATPQVADAKEKRTKARQQTLFPARA